ncbi:MAG: OmpA family protein [Treponema sp.]
MKHYLFIFFLLTIFTSYADEAYCASDSVCDWTSGRIDSRITLDVEKMGLSLPSAKTTSYQLIKRYMPSVLKNAYLSIVMDSSHRLGDYLARGEIDLSDLNVIMDSGKEKSPIFSQDLSDVILFHSVATNDIAKFFVKHEVSRLPFGRAVSSIGKSYTGILIDARGKLPIHGEYVNDQLTPCIFPKIWDTNMDLLYEKNMVSPETLMKQNIVVYSDTLDESSYADIIGVEPLRIIARGIFGQNRTDPIISTQDSAKLLSREENLRLLEEGRVVILCDKEMLKVASSSLAPDDNFYFAYHDIEKVIDESKAKGIEPSKGKNIIKLTVYDIKFVADKPDVLPEETGRLDVIVEALLKVAGDAHFLIEGHTADLNKPEEQLELSIRRAEKIAEELVKRGLDANRIQTAGYGSTRPIAPSDTRENRAKNRRVEITIIRD